jgi:hypothetical protein
MNGQRHLRLVEPPPPRLHRLSLRIAAADGRSPIGQTRIFRLTDHDFEQLVDDATRLEARR